MSDFIRAQSSAFIAHRLRRSSDRIVEQVGAVLPTLGIDLPPRGASMMLLIDQDGPIGIVEISRRLRLSHPLIVRMAQRFVVLGLATIEPDAADARRRLVTVTDKGRHQAGLVRALNDRLSKMFDGLFDEIGCPLIDVLDRLDAALETVPIAQRVPKPPTD